MQKVIVAAGCREIDSPDGLRHYARGGSRGYAQGGVFEMSDANAKLAVKMGGAIASLAGVTRRAIGWRCGSCGFASYLRRCGRCGAECGRE
jgi:hypothetical protein